MPLNNFSQGTEGKKECSSKHWKVQFSFKNSICIKDNKFKDKRK